MIGLLLVLCTYDLFGVTGLIPSPPVSFVSQPTGTATMQCPLERVPTPLIDRLVRCSAHGGSLVRLWYICTAKMILNVTGISYRMTDR